MKVTLSIDDVTFTKFKKFCESNGYKVSTLVALLIKEYLSKKDILS